MVKISTVIALGVFIAIIPFTGFPNDSALPIKNILYIFCGLLIAVLSVMIRKELEEVVKHLHTHAEKIDTFTDSNPNQSEEIK